MLVDSCRSTNVPCAAISSKVSGAELALSRYMASGIEVTALSLGIMTINYTIFENLITVDIKAEQHVLWGACSG
jgi:hypothetical protein